MVSGDEGANDYVDAATAQEVKDAFTAKIAATVAKRKSAAAFY